MYEMQILSVTYTHMYGLTVHPIRSHVVFQYSEMLLNVWSVPDKVSHKVYKMKILYEGVLLQIIYSWHVIYVFCTLLQVSVPVGKMNDLEIIFAVVILVTDVTAQTGPTHCSYSDGVYECNYYQMTSVTDRPLYFSDFSTQPQQIVLNADGFLPYFGKYSFLRIMKNIRYRKTIFWKKCLHILQTMYAKSMVA